LPASTPQSAEERRRPSSQVDYNRFPVRPFNWNLIIEPLKPKETSRGGIYIPEEAQSVEKVQTTVGRVIAVGPTAFTGKSQSGVDMSRFSHTITDPQDLIGRHVIYARYTGSQVKLKGGKTLLIIDDTNILCDISDPELLVFHYDG
jgi:co-chaperonin GroES (HSP10)